jgi:hypothetical protein
MECYSSELVALKKIKMDNEHQGFPITVSTNCCLMSSRAPTVLLLFWQAIREIKILKALI